MSILDHPAEWLNPYRALELVRSGLETAEGHVARGEHEQASLAFYEVSMGLIWQARRQRALANAKPEEE